MATPLRQPTPRAAAPNASDFVELYAFERPAAPLPIDDFVDELKTLVCEHPVEPALAEALKYGGVEREAMRRWLKEYYQFIRLDAQGTAATIARAMCGRPTTPPPANSIAATRRLGRSSFVRLRSHQQAMARPAAS